MSGPTVTVYKVKLRPDRMRDVDVLCDACSWVKSGPGCRRLGRQHSYDTGHNVRLRSERWADLDRLAFEVPAELAHYTKRPS